MKEIEGVPERNVDVINERFPLQDICKAGDQRQAKKSAKDESLAVHVP
jgi:hypothetical protein